MSRDANWLVGLELEVFAGLGLYPTYVVMQGFSSATSVILLATLNVYKTPPIPQICGLLY
jgi:hypothetical protein